jgi:hypothetical protein
MAASRFVLALSCGVSASLVSFAVAADPASDSNLKTALDTAQTSGKLVFVYAFDSV